MYILSKKKQHNTKPAAFKLDSDLKEDFWDYESKLAKTRQNFGDTRPIVSGNTTYAEQNYELLDKIYHTTGIAHKVVTKPAEDATRNSWRIVINGDSKKQLQYQKALDELHLEQVLSQELIYQRLHGDGYITFKLDQPGQKQDLSSPLGDRPVLKKITFVHAFGQDHVNHLEISNDPTSDDYMKESALVINQTTTGTKVDKDGNPTYQVPKTKPIVIDKSRYFHISLDKLEDDEVGNSIITRCYDSIKVLDTLLYSVGKIAYAYDINVVYSNQMPSTDTPTGEAQFRARQRALTDGMGTDSVLLLNQTGEKFERISTNVSGIDSLMQFAWQNLAAASNIPKSVLLGEQAGTLAGASQDVINYYDGIKATQEQVLRPQLEKIIKLLFWSSDIAGGSEDPDSVDWKLEFNPLWSLDDKTQSEVNLNNTNAEVARVNAGIDDPDEAKENLIGQNNNQIQSMQSKHDAEDEFESQFSKEQIEQYKRDLEKAHENE